MDRATAFSHRPSKQNHSGCVIKVSFVDVGTAIAHEDLFNLVVLSARQPDMAPLFNAASSAWNNAFFFMGIVTISIFS